MSSFLYSLLLVLLYPSSISMILLLSSAALRKWKRERLAQAAFWSGIGILLICGNGYLVDAATRYLETRYGPLQEQIGAGADCILILSGGIAPKIPPRPTVEISEAGDRLLYGAYLFKQQKAPQVVCTGDFPNRGPGGRTAADEMAEFLHMIGLSEDAILTECKSQNTYLHAKYLYPMLKERGFKKVLLVTSALHMPRSMGVFRRNCPDIEFIPAPTDFRTLRKAKMPWHRHILMLIPTPNKLSLFNESAHEYLGIGYYKIRGWI